jgi:hypothetical protein
MSSLVPILSVSALYIALFCTAYFLYHTIFFSGWRRCSYVGSPQQAGFKNVLAKPADSFVAPFEVEYLPNPVIFPALSVLCAGYHAVRDRWDARNDVFENEEVQEADTSKNDEGEVIALRKSDEANREKRFSCGTCGMQFDTRGLRK